MLSYTGIIVGNNYKANMYDGWNGKVTTTKRWVILKRKIFSVSVMPQW